ncbi:MAG: thiolase family protein [Armatimonadota bacterium]|nr:thiolase family protein [Armatimonadota bacterium]MDR5675226.1 thiolase family protein [Armatimonadota bacterium]MDR5688597.1 thiolase family protein [Armatimonadota bacterium]MDR7386694.1 thiolase family protein [Armatimonadota bacterium]MDR7389849.1 thiolase family protein [Armatimonadota bacterium]
MDVYVVGAGMTKFGKHPDRDAVDLAVEAVNEAIRDAGVDRRRIQAAYCGHVYGGMVLGQKVLARTGLAGIPLANVENACSSGATAIREGYLAIRAGEYDVVLAFGVEHLTTRFRGALTPGEEDLEGALGLTMPAVYAMRAVRHMTEFGTTREELAYVSVKNKRNASLNPYAQFQNPVTVEDVLNSRPIADPLRLLDCCPVSDGAAAVILASERVVGELGRSRAVRLAAASLRTGTVEVGLPSMAFEPLTRATAQDAYERAGVGPEDVDFAEVHDCFSIAEVLRVEGLGLYPVGEYPKRAARGEADIGGRLPINPSGGLLGKGHPLGATGVAQVVELVRQLRGEAGPRQIEGARVGLAHCRGGKAAGVEGAACTVLIATR